MDELTKQDVLYQLNTSRLVQHLRVRKVVEVVTAKFNMQVPICKSAPTSCRPC